MRPSHLLALLLVAPGSALALDVVLPVHGQLHTAAGAPVDGELDVTFTLWSDSLRSASLYTETQPIDFDGGVFSAYIGTTGALGSELFHADQAVWLGIRIGADAEMDLIRVGWAPLAGYADMAGDAESVEGHVADEFLSPEWTSIQDVPPDIADGDQLGPTYAAGEGIRINGGTIAAEPTWFIDLALDTCLDSESELHDLLDDDYLPTGWVVSWDEIDGIPADIADGDDLGSGGGGSVMWGDIIGVPSDLTDGDDPDQSTVEGWARGVCYDTQGELTTALAGQYKPAGYVPSWGEITGIPADIADGDDLGSGGGGGPDQGTVEGWARGVCYDSQGELTAALAGQYKPAGYTPSWGELTGIPADIADGDQTGPNQSTVEGWSRGVCYDNQTELITALAGLYKPATYLPAWAEITGMPADIADGDQTGPNQSTVEGWSRGVCYDSQSELTTALAGQYKPAGYLPAWGELTGMPADIADGDDLGPDQSTVEGWSRGVCYDTPTELYAQLDARYLSASSPDVDWADLSGVPADFADDVDDDLLDEMSCPEGFTVVSRGGAWDCEEAATPFTDEDAVAAVEAVNPAISGWLRNPLVLFDIATDLCKNIYADYGGFIKFPTRFTNVPIVMATIDESITNSGASWSNAELVSQDRVGINCNAESDGLAWMAIDPGTHTIDGKMVQAGLVASARTNDTIFFSTLFDAPPIVLVYPGDGNAWIRIIGSSGVTTGGFQVHTNTADKALRWIAMEPGSYEYGRYHWEAGKVADPDNNDTFTLTSTFGASPGLLFSIVDTNDSGAAYVRLIGVTQTTFQIYMDSNSSEFLNYVAFEEDR